MYNSKIRHVGGKHIYYYLTCKSQLWLYSKNIRFQDQSEQVDLGSQIHEEFFRRQKHREVAIDGIKVDFLGKSATVHEVKSSLNFREEHVWQLRFYLYYLKTEKGLESVSGVLHYPRINRKIPVSLVKKDEDKLNIIVRDIERICDLPLVPVVENSKKFCQKCAYYEYCFA